MQLNRSVNQHEAVYMNEMLSFTYSIMNSMHSLLQMTHFSVRSSDSKDKQQNVQNSQTRPNISVWQLYMLHKATSLQTSVAK